MASLSPPAPDLTSCTPFYATDPVLGHIVVFYSSTAPTISSAPRIEAHILSSAGFQSYPKLALNQSSTLYSVVHHLPPQLQNSVLHHGLAIAVFKYFSELPKNVKETILRCKSNAAPAGELQAVAFDEMHAGDLTARLKEVELDTLAHDLMWALSERFVSVLDLDIVVRSGDQEFTSDNLPEEVTKFLDCFGEPTYLPFTKIKRTASKPASAQQRPRPLKDLTEALGRELEELRYTEENYVAKIQDLLDNIVIPLKRRASSKKPEWGSMSARDLDALFPPCLEDIIKANTKFLEGIREGGVEEVAKCCLEVFPLFREPYEEYIQASADFPQLLNKFTKNRDSSFSRKIQQTGEQKLRSLIIEPVQRLPRYSLLIDNMINILPPEHPSLARLNDARNLIADICSLQSSESSERSITIKRLQNIIAAWPQSLQPSGRLITAIDFLEVLPPYNEGTSESIQSIMLLFPDCIVILRRPSLKSMLARGVMAEVDRPGGGVNVTNLGSGNRREGAGYDLQFLGWIDTAEIKLAASDNGTVLWMTMASNLRDGWDIRASGTTLRKMRLLNQYEGRAHKVEEEFAKARLERRAGPNAKGVIGIREAKFEGFGLWSVVWGAEARYAEKEHKGSTVIYLDMESSSNNRALLATLVGQGGVDCIFSVEKSGEDKVRLECRSWSDYSSTDLISYEELLSVFTMRLSSLLRLHCSAQHPPLTASLMSANRKLVRSLGIPFEGESSRFGKLRTPSPVKLISSILDRNQPNTPSKARTILDRSQSQMLPPPQKERPQSMLLRGSTMIGLVSDSNSADDDARFQITMANESPLKKLEDTFEAFVNALRIIGNTAVDLTPLHEIHDVDDDAVAVLLGQLVEAPKRCRLGPETGIDVVFVAFATFLNRDWKDGMGPVISEKGLKELQSKSETLHFQDFEDFFRIFIMDWTPQNKRAFRTIIFLLKDMMDKVDAEDDKGMLTKIFTELIVGDEMNALEYMGLVDLLVEEMETLFNESPPPALENGAVKRAKSVQTSAPSLRKRLGLSHASSLRETGKLEKSERSERSHSMWRSLSKHRDKDKDPDRYERSKSKDRSSRKRDKSRPGSRDSRDHPLGYGGGSANQSASSLLSNVSTISAVSGYSGVSGYSDYDGGVLTPTRPTMSASKLLGSALLSSPIHLAPPTVTPPPLVPRRKRRSSLSDLTDHPDYRPAQAIGGPRVQPPLRSAASDLPVVEPVVLEPEALSVVKQSPRQGSSLTRGLSNASINSNTSHASNGGLSRGPSDAGSVSLQPTKRKLPGPPPRTKSFGATSAVPVPARLKMQSPQKLRERLHNEKAALTDVDASLQHEIDLIGAELNSALHTLKSTSSLRSERSQSNLDASAIKQLSARLADLETRFAEHISGSALSSSPEIERERIERDRERAEQIGRIKMMHSDIDKLKATLMRKDQEIEELDKALKDCVAENDILFERFNMEIVKMAEAFRVDRGERELMDMLTGVREELGRVKRENMLLRRENVALKSVTSSSTPTSATLPLIPPPLQLPTPPPQQLPHLSKDGRDTREGREGSTTGSGNHRHHHYGLSF